MLIKSQHSNEAEALSDGIREAASPLYSLSNLDKLIDRIGDARFVLLGEASHGTSEYYQWRAHLSKRLIEERGFSFIAVEGDWPDCYRLNRYIKGYPDAGDSARDVLHAFDRWPTWMWANWEIVALAEWLRDYNQSMPPSAKVGFYGLDVYSLWESLREVTQYLENTVPEAVQAAREAYLCFQPYHQDVQAYARATRMVPESCEEEVIQLLTETQRRAAQDYPNDREAAFNAEQNARVTVGAERYYRAMIKTGPDSWNVRDYHMTDTLQRLLANHGEHAKAIIWEHNTHIGDARATDMAAAGMVNVGQLIREQRQADGVVLVGFGSYRGSVIAGRAWDAPMEIMQVPEAKEESWEAVLHETLGENSLLLLTDGYERNELFRRPRGHRAISVVYNPQYDRISNFVPTSLSRRYDAFVYLDQTSALHPLHIQPEASLEPPETYPWSM